MQGAKDHKTVSAVSSQDTRASLSASGASRASLMTLLAGRIIVGLALVCGLATYLILTGLTPLSPNHDVVIVMLTANVVLIIAMLGLIAWQVYQLWRARQRQAAAARLHTRIVSLFSVVALLPAVLLAVFATISLSRGLDHWFSSRINSIIQSSIDVANAYVNEQGQIIRTDTVGVAKELDESSALLKESKSAFSAFLSAQAALHAIPFAYVIKRNGQVLAKAASKANLPYRIPPPAAFTAADDGRVVELAQQSTAAVGALTRLASIPDAYLYVLRPINPVVIAHLRRTKANVIEYSELEQRRAGVQIAFAAMFIAIALTFLFAAIWVGLWFADRLVAPIRQLIDAAQQVSLGNLNVAVPVAQKTDDVDKLGLTFNEMTTELRSQRNELIGTNAMLDERRRFIEAVLSGVSAGVIGLDSRGFITLVNRSAIELLEQKERALIGQPLSEAVREFADLLAQAQKQAKKPVQTQVKLLRAGGERNFAVRITRESAQDQDYGFVLTFDDITELVVAQRSTAWADVARRIAHEIKNPLTPIQLSAERIRRKYGDAITGDREVFDRCTDTIIRHVGDIGRMVDEFSAFARMPKPVIEEHDLREIVREAVILFQVSHPEIDYELDLPDEPMLAQCDRRLITQAVTNLVKNAGEAIEARAQQERSVAAANGAGAGKSGAAYKGHIRARVVHSGGAVQIEVSDNGCGLPKEDRRRLVEPYVTTRQKGTGLGLAIVHKVVEQHGGKLSLEDAGDTSGQTAGTRSAQGAPAGANGGGGASLTGARVVISLPAETDAPAQMARSGAKTTPSKSKKGAGASNATRTSKGSASARNKKRSKQGISHGI